MAFGCESDTVGSDRGTLMSTLTRRDFLMRGGGLLVVGFNWRLFATSASTQRDILPELAHPQYVPSARTLLNPEDLDSWLAIAANGKVTVYTGRIDMGTGVETSFAQFVADELEVPFEDVTMVMGDTGVTPDQGKSTASSNSSRGAQPLRRAAAEARLFLLTLASERLQTPIEGLAVQDGVVRILANPAKSVTYGEVLEGRRFDRRLKVTVPQ